LQVENKNAGEFSKKVLTLQNELQVSELVPVTLRAIVGLPGGRLASSAKMIPVTTPIADTPQISSLMLTNQVRQDQCSDKAETLCLDTMRLVQPATASFVSGDRLVVYFTVAHLASDPQSKQPRIGLDLKLRTTGSGAQPITAKTMQAIPGPSSGTVMVLADFDLHSLAPGKYSIQAVAQDLVKKSSATNQAEFSVQ
jgi:hypothetical protein